MEIQIQGETVNIDERPIIRATQLFKNDRAAVLEGYPSRINKMCI